MMRGPFILRLALFLCLGGTVWSEDVTHEPRLALVMGVSDCQNPRFPALPGIDKDLGKMSAALKTAGFQVTVVSNPTLGEAEDAIRAFGAKLKAQAGGVGLFYFSGHGGELDGKNYLVPRGVRIGSLRDIRDQGVAAQSVLNLMEDAGARVNLVFLDCCRNDLTKGASGGLAPMSAKGTFIGFATATNKVSLAGDDGSPFTTFLAKRLLMPNASIFDMYTQVTADVENYTRSNGAEEQTPFQYSGLNSSFYFMPRGAGTSGSRAALDTAPTVPSPPDAPHTGEPGAPAGSTGLAIKATRAEPYVNSLGMEFVPVPNTRVLFCRTDARVQDFRGYSAATNYVQAPGAVVLKAPHYSPTWFLTAWQVDLTASWKNPGYHQKDDHPVVCVSWQEAKAFCAWLSAKEGCSYRLPTDAEWSAAVGAHQYPWGDQWPPPAGAGNYADESFNRAMPGKGWPPALANDGFARTSPVGHFQANECGLYDMGGNVWQWCDDEYKASMVDQQTLAMMPTARIEKYEDGSPLRITRGASWALGDMVFLRSITRIGVPAITRTDQLGFRCVLVLPDR